MMADPLFIVSVVGIPMALVVAVMLWRRSRAISADPWYGTSVVPRVHASACAEGLSTSDPINPDSVDAEPFDPLLLCEKVLFCWDYWARGRSGLHLEDVFEARDLPTELRAAIARSRGESGHSL